MQTIEEAAANLSKEFHRAYAEGDGCCFPESDTELNDASRKLITAFINANGGTAYLVHVNPSPDHKDCPLEAVTHESQLYNFGGSYVIGKFDEPLEKLVKDRLAAQYTGPTDDRVRVEAICNRVDEIGGKRLWWS